MEGTAVCLLHAESDDRGRLYKTARWKLEEMATLLKPAVSSASWIYDGTLEGTGTILSIAPHLEIQITKAELDEFMDATESNQLDQRKSLPVMWVPSLASESIDGPFGIELKTARDELFTRLEGGNNVLACMSEQYFRALFEFIGGAPYTGQLQKGDAVILHFRLQTKAEITEGEQPKQTPAERPSPELCEQKSSVGRKEFVLHKWQYLTA